MAKEEAYFHGTGRRKTAIAQVKLVNGSGTVIVNNKPLEEAFPIERLQTTVMSPLKLTNKLSNFNAVVKVSGGGICAQAGAIRHGISRALAAFDETLKPLLRTQGMLTRDSRAKERKKYGLVRARKAKQYRKR